MPKRQKQQQPELFAEPPRSVRIVVDVAFESGADETFTYALPDGMDVRPGQRVEVTFGRKNAVQVGFVVGVRRSGPEDSANASGRPYRLKEVRRILDEEPLLNERLLELARWVSDYYVSPLGQVLGAMVPAAVKKGIGLRERSYYYLIAPEAELSRPQHKKVAEVLRAAGALTEAKALSKEELAAAAEVSPAVLKTLEKKQVIIESRRSLLHALPVIPEDLRVAEHPVTLTDEQQHALTRIRERMHTAAFGVTLLHGVTSSGKTEIYLRAIDEVIRMGRQAIVLVPEIALTAQTVERFRRRFSGIAVMHSELTAAQRNHQWHEIREGRAEVVVGARSAVFSPLPKLGLIVVDEEHEGSYKQDTVPRYHGRDAAIKRAQLESAHVILGSATPSLEMLHNCRTREYFDRIPLTRRVMNMPMPEMRLVDMSSFVGPGGQIRLLSDELEKQMTAALERGEQIILLLNRRGYSFFIRCGACGHVVTCPNCDVAMTFHRRKTAVRSPAGEEYLPGVGVCHHCLSQAMVRRACPLCRGGMELVGLGSQKLEEVVQGRFPGARVERFDSDAVAGKDYYRILKDFAEGNIDILAGTQMLAKGLHFPNVTLVGVVSADTALSLADFRSNERTFQLISQVSGRAGREGKPGRVVVQTLFPGHSAIEHALRHDYEGFVEEELCLRAELGLPPYARIAVVQMRDEKYDRLSQAAEAMKARLDVVAKNEGLGVHILGPMDAPIARVARMHRMQIVLKAKDAPALNKLFRAARKLPAIRPAVQTVYDVDPVHIV